MDIKIVGAGCDKCTDLYNMVVEMTKENNISADISKVEDLIEIVTLGVLSTPALMVDGKILHKGSVPNKKKLAKYLGL